MPIHQSEAIVLKSQDFKESSKITTLYTKKFGRIKVVAKGAKRLKSKFGASLDIGVHNKVIFYYHESRDLYILSESEIIRHFSNIYNDLNRFLQAELALEMVLRFTPPGTPNLAIFSLLVNYLRALKMNTSVKELNYFQWSFSLRLLTLLGYQPQLHHCVVCKRTPSPNLSVVQRSKAILNVGAVTEKGGQVGQKGSPPKIGAGSPVRLLPVPINREGATPEGCGVSDEEIYFSIQRGGLVCRHCYRLVLNALPVLTETIYLMQDLQKGSRPQKISFPVAEQIEWLLKSFTNYHLSEGLQSLKVEKNLTKIQ
ncbi:MAG: DNA repair protein RecO [Candidatus Edwardsbacteria bacterium]